MDGRKVVNLLQEGYRMQKPEHVDNKLLVKNLSIYFHGNFAQVILSSESLSLPVSKVWGSLVPNLGLSDHLPHWTRQVLV